jgi:hypothetical protein
MIYVLRNQILIPGKMAEYAKISQEISPVAAKDGSKMVASFHNYTGNMNSDYGIFAYKDLAEMQEFAARVRQNQAYQKLYAQMEKLYTNLTRTK